MKVTFVGAGDAFGTGQRAHTCIRIDADGRTLLLDFGAASIVGWRRLGFSFRDVDAIYITHLHGDHFGGLPMLMLETQFVEPRDKPLAIVGPPGLRDRLATVMEAFYAGSTAIPWRFDWRVEEMTPGSERTLAGFAVRTVEVLHDAGAPPTAVRVSRTGKSFAFSGDTAWTDALIEVSDRTDLFACECQSMRPGVPGHMDWPQLKANLPRLGARRVMLTHMGADVLGALPQICAESGVEAAEDGLVVEI